MPYRVVSNTCPAFRLPVFGKFVPQMKVDFNESFHSLTSAGSTAEPPA